MYIYVVLQEKKTFKTRKKSYNVHNPYARNSGLSARNNHFVGSSGSLYRGERLAEGPLFDFVSS